MDKASLDALTIQYFASFLHDRYEHHAVKCGWKTQEGCSVPFNKLPMANQRVMRAVAADVVNEVCAILEAKGYGRNQEKPDTDTPPA